MLLRLPSRNAKRLSSSTVTDAAKIVQLPSFRLLTHPQDKRKEKPGGKPRTPGSMIGWHRRQAPIPITIYVQQAGALSWRVDGRYTVGFSCSLDSCSLRRASRDCAVCISIPRVVSITAPCQSTSITLSGFIGLDARLRVLVAVPTVVGPLPRTVTSQTSQYGRRHGIRRCPSPQNELCVCGTPSEPARL